MQSFSFAEMQPLLPLIIAQPQRFRNAKSPVPATGLLHIPLPAPRGHTRVLPFPEKSLPASAAAPSASACRAALPALLVAFETTSSAPRCFCLILRSQFEIAAPVMRDPRPVENGRQNKHRVKNGHALFFSRHSPSQCSQRPYPLCIRHSPICSSVRCPFSPCRQFGTGDGRSHQTHGIHMAV